MTPLASPKPTRQPTRSKVGGVMLIIASPSIAILLFLLLISAISDERFYFYGAAFLLLGALAGIRTGLQLLAPDAQELMRRDPRPPIVFLRSFQEDSRVVYGSPIGRREGGEQSGNVHGKTAHERILANLLRGVGPFVAVGQPGEKLAKLGAARAYLSDDEWMDTVKSMVRRAGAIILQPEFSSGTMWEIELVASEVDLKRLLLIVPNPHVRPLRYLRVRQLVQERLSIELPPPETCPPCDAFYFDDDKNPIPLRLEAPGFLGLGLPERAWRFVGATREARADAITMLPPVLLVPSRNLSMAAKPFLDRITALGNLGRARV